LGKAEEIQQGLPSIERRPHCTEDDWFRFIKDGAEHHVGKQHLCHRLAGQRDAVPLRDHAHQCVPADIEAADGWLTPMFGQTQNDMIIHLWTAPAMPDKECLGGKVSPANFFGLYQDMSRRQNHDEGFRPEWLGMAVLNGRCAENEGDIEPFFTDKPDDVFRPALNDLDVDVGMSITVPVQEIGKEAVGDRGM